MNLEDLLVASTVTLAISLAIGGIGVALIFVLRHAPLFVQLIVALFAGLAAVVLSMIAVAQMMYLSEHDFIVAINVAVVSGISSAIVAGALGVWISRNSRALSRAVERVGRGEIITASAATTSAELARVERVLAETSEQLRESREREARIQASRRELVAWISHDLRTPLAGIRAMAEALEDGLAEDPARYYRQMRGQVELLASMVDDLFDLSKMDAGGLRLTLQDVSLMDVVSDAVAELGPATRGRAVVVESGLAEDLLVRVDPSELSRAIGNLVMNAVQHTPAPGRVVVRTELVDGAPTISVIDRGAGIDEADLARIFEPGWRGSAARTPRTAEATSPGAGLGLAIVRGIVSAHRGEVSVMNLPVGCRFDIQLPAELAQTL